MEYVAAHSLQVDVATEALGGGALFFEFPRMDHIVWFPTVEQLQAMSDEDRLSRNIIFFLAFAAVTVITTIIGMTILARPGRRRFRSFSTFEMELAEWTESAADQGLDVGASASVLFEEQDDEVGGCCQAKCRSRFCLIPMCAHILLCSSACAVSLWKKQFSKDTGLNWEFYLIIWTVNALWMNLQAIIRVFRSTPSTSFALSTYPMAAMAGTAPYLSEWFDTLLDTIFGFMCLASPHYPLQVLGVVALTWLLSLHVVLALCWKDAAVEIFSAYFSVLDAEPIDPRLKELPFSTKCWLKLYSQCSPVRRRMTEMEDLPQAVFKILYAYYEEPNFVFTAVMILLPMCKIVAGYCFQRCLARRIVPFWRRSLTSAMVCDNQEKLREVDEVLCLDGQGELLTAVLDPGPLASSLDAEGQTNERDELLSLLQDRGEGYSPLSKLASLSMQLAREAASKSVSLEVHKTELHQSHVCFLTRQAADVNLHKLHFYDIKLSNSALKVLAKSVMLTVEDLGLVNCQIGDAGAGIISIGMKRSKRLRHLDLTENRIGVKGGHAIGLCLKDAQKLESLHLSVQRWLSSTGEPGAIFLQSLTEEACPLQALCLSLTSTSTSKPTSAKALSLPWSKLLLAPANLTVLTLNGQIVDSNQAKDIGEALALNTSLTHLDLSFNNIGDVGVEKLVINLEDHNSTLKKLYLQHVRCTDRALLSLTIFKRPHLRYLDLLGNQISHEATKILGQCGLLTPMQLTSRVSEFYMGHTKFVTDIPDYLRGRIRVFQPVPYKKSDWSELHRACYEGDVQFVENYVRSEVIEGLETFDAERATPLAVAARHGELKIVKLLLAAMADPTCGDNTGLKDAVHAQHGAVVVALLQAGAGRTKLGVETVAWAAAVEGALELIDVDINMQDHEGQTPLFIAAMEGSAKQVAALIAARADVDIKCGRSKEVPLLAACRRQDSAEIVQHLLQARSSANAGSAEDQRSALHIACIDSSVAIVGLLLDAGADIEALDAGCCSPLFYADEAAKAKLLVERKAAISDGCLFDAATMPKKEAKVPYKLKLLLDANANPNAQRGGWPLLFFIAANAKLWGVDVAGREKQQLEMMRAVIASRADVNCFADGSKNDGVGGSCIAQVASYKRLDMLQLLISSAAQVDLPTQESGKTALFFACEKNCPAAALMLLEASADPNLANKGGETPLQLVQYNDGMKRIFEQHRKGSGSKRTVLPPPVDTAGGSDPCENPPSSLSETGPMPADPCDPAGDSPASCSESGESGDSPASCSESGESCSDDFCQAKGKGKGKKGKGK